MPNREPIAWRHIAGSAALLLALLLLGSGGYGYHRDELYFRMLAPAWGYVDQPPLTPLLAEAVIAAFGDHLWAIRVPAALAAVAVGCVESVASFHASAYKEVIVFTVIIPVLLWRSLRGPAEEE